MEKIKKHFKYVILLVLLLIPFIYSYFYLKAYWNPYGSGNMDNLPIAIVNKDDGDKGSDLVAEIIDSKALKITLDDELNAMNGLNNKSYYAVITIPENFTDSLNSINTEEKIHPTITYSPNQKSNYLASQIIDRVVATVEGNLNNEINSEIISELNKNLNEVPDKLTDISSGFDELYGGIKKLSTGSNTIKNGNVDLLNNYQEYNKAIKEIKDGSNTLEYSTTLFNNSLNGLNDSLTLLDSLKTNINTLSTGINNISTSNNSFNNSLNEYTTNINETLELSKNFALYIVTLYENNNVPNELKPNIELYKYAKKLITKDQTTNLDSIDIMKISSNKLTNGSNELNDKIKLINSNMSKLNDATNNFDKLNKGISTLINASNKILEGTTTLNDGINTISEYSDKIEDGITKLNDGNNELNNGINTLDSKVFYSKNLLNQKINQTKTDLNKTNNLEDYSKNPVIINKEVVNEVDSYGTSFSPLFISIGLWIGSLMLYIVLLFDKESRFGILDINSQEYIKRTLSYHGLATISSIILGILLSIFLDLNISNYLLYLFIMILIANTFTAIINFFIINFRDIGKFIILILLILQLAAAGGTFPIETVTSSFRWLHNLLPMTYTINLLKECLVVVEQSIIWKNIIIVSCIFLVFFIINLIIDIKKQRRVSK